MEIKAKYNIGDEVYFLQDMKIFRATIDKINVTLYKSFGKITTVITYCLTAHSSGGCNFIPSCSPATEDILFKNEVELIQNIKIIK